MYINKFVALVAIALCSALTAEAQSYMDHLRQNRNGKGRVVVTQSAEIDRLVNGSGVGSPVAKPVGQESSTQRKATTKTGAATTQTPKVGAESGRTVDAAAKAEEARREAEARRIAENKARETTKTEKEEGEMEIPTIDMRKKVMRGSRKVTGYRVQAFAGGNTRQDKLRAQQIGEAIKMKFPEQPIYVHFYSPRWICRVGNFRTYQEAQQVLKQVRAMGYKAATIVKGQITVQD